MKKITYLFILSLFALSSCVVHHHKFTNIAGHNTEVVLSKKNYRVLERVSGESETFYLLGILGGYKESLIEEARQDMMQKANLTGGAKALAYETVSERYTNAIIGIKVKVIVSAYVVEFSE
jgi:hypothetical protein